MIHIFDKTKNLLEFYLYLNTNRISTYNKLKGTESYRIRIPV